MISIAVTRMAWIAVAASTAARLLVAARLPLSGDEAYYWEWSRRLAFGYLDHPPMVAWLIAVFDMGQRSAFLVRLPFVLCGLGAALALAAFVTRATGDRLAGAFAALVLSLAPFATIAFTMAAPDGPELFFWSLSLYLGLRALEPAGSGFRIPLAVAVAATLLSSLLGAFLMLGIVVALTAGARLGAHGDIAASPARHALVALALFGVAIAPYIMWDAAHGWAATRFALLERHPFVPGGNIAGLLALLIAVLTPGVFVALGWTIATLASSYTLANRLVLWTSLPLLATCLLLATRERVEFNWLDGAALSLVGGLGLCSAQMSRASRALVIAPAAAATLLMFAVALFPMQALQLAGNAFGLHLRNQGAFEIWAYEPAARDLANETRASGAMVMTDGYGLSSVLDFYGGVTPVVIGYDSQGREARGWFTGGVRSRAIFLDKEPLQSRPDLQQRLRRACARVTDLGSRTYRVRGEIARTFYLTGCDGLTSGGLSLLRFPDKS